MTNRRKFTITCSLLAGGVLVQAQTPPAPPAPPTPPSAVEPAMAPITPMAPMAPRPMAAPQPAAAPRPPMPPRDFVFDHDFNFDFDVNVNIDRVQIEEQVEAARAMAEQAREDGRAMAEQARENMRLLGPEIAAARAMASTHFAFAPQVSVGGGGPKPRSLNGSESSLYQRGQSALDSKRWDDAVVYFGEVFAKNGSRTDGALHWNASPLQKLAKPPSPPTP